VKRKGKQETEDGYDVLSFDDKGYGVTWTRWLSVQGKVKTIDQVCGEKGVVHKAMTAFARHDVTRQIFGHTPTTGKIRDMCDDGKAFAIDTAMSRYMQTVTHGVAGLIIIPGDPDQVKEVHQTDYENPGEFTTTVLIPHEAMTEPQVGQLTQEQKDWLTDPVNKAVDREKQDISYRGTPHGPRKTSPTTKRKQWKASTSPSLPGDKSPEERPKAGTSTSVRSASRKVAREVHSPTQPRQADPREGQQGTELIHIVHKQPTGAGEPGIPEETTLSQ